MLTVAQLMTHHADRIAPNASIAAAAMLMADSDISSVIVAENDQIVGIVTERDLLDAMHRQLDPNQPASEIMTRQIEAVPANLAYADAYRRIRRKNTRHLVVVDMQGKPLGVLSETDFRRHLGLDFFSQFDNADKLMDSRFTRLPADTPLNLALAAMLTGHESSVVVVEGERAIGIIAEHDLPRLLLNNDGNAPLGSIMSPELVTIRTDTPLSDAAQTMLELRIRDLPVIAGENRLVGLLTERALMQPLERCLIDDDVDDPALLKAVQTPSARIISRNERYQRALLDNFPYLVWLKDTESRFLAVNRQLSDSMGEVGAEAVIGRSDLDYAPPDLAERYRADDAKIMASGQKMVVIEEIVCNGLRTWHETYKAPVMDDQGLPMGTVGFARNISGSQRTEEATLIRNAALAGLLQDERLENLLELIALSAETELPGVICSILLVTADGRRLRLGGAPSLPDTCKTKLEGIEIADGIGVSGSAAFRKARVVSNDLFSDPVGQDFHDFGRDAGITSGWAEPILAPDGELLGTFAAYSSKARQPAPEEKELLRLASQLAALVISHRRNSDQLFASQTTFRGIFDSLDEAIFVLDQRGRVHDINTRAERLSGYRRAELTGKTYRHLLAKGFNPKNMGSHIAKTLAGTPQIVEMWGKSLAERIFPVEIRMRPGNYFGKQVVIASVQDISERKIAAERLIIERDLAEALASGKSREDFPRLLLDIALRFPEFDCGGVYEINANGTGQLVEHKGLSSDFVARTRIFSPDTALARLLQSGQVTCSCAECTGSCTDRNLIGNPQFQQEGLRCLAVLPIVTEGRAVACITLASHHTALISHGTLLALQTLSTRFAQALIRVEAEAEARRLQQDLAGLFEAMNDCLIIISLQGNILHCNRAVSDLLGYAQGSLIGKPLSAIHPPEFRELAVEIGQAMAAGTQKTCLLPLLRADGTSFTAETRAFKGYWQGNPAILCVSQDISERLRGEARQKLAASVFDNAHEGIMITDSNARIVDVNETFTELTGYARDEAIGNPAGLLKSGHHAPEFYAEMWKTIQDAGYWRGEVWNRKKSGEIFVERLTISTVRDGLGKISNFVGIFSDITLIKEHQQRLERLAHFDALTQLPNRMLLSDRLQLAMSQADRSGKTLAVGYLDLDGFKPVNDRYGHATGDRLLMEIAQRLKACVRGGDTVARLGGDEFVILLSGLESEPECDQAISRIVSALSQPFTINGHEITISASVGVTVYPQDGADADTLLRHADQAMYAAKQAGRNRHHLFDPENDRRAKARRNEIERIRNATVNGEFVLFYQPKVNMRTGRVTGAEALIRWKMPDGTLLLPENFLGALAGNELAIWLGDWVIREALRQMAAWSAQGIEIAVSVNIDGDHLHHPEFSRRLAKALTDHPSVAPNQLELEVIETAALENFELTADLFAECRKLGVRFALDDFGTGYSSLTYFRRLPADILKIDQSFIRDMLFDPEDLATVEGIIGLTRAYKRCVIAEGVESREHGLALLLLGCDHAQGFGIAHPMPAEMLPEWIARFRPDALWAVVNSGAWSREMIPLLVAEADHKRWAKALLAHLDDHSGQFPMPEANHKNCRFGHWYYGKAHDPRYAHGEAFQAIEAHHIRLHELGGHLVNRHRHADPASLDRLKIDFEQASSALTASVQRVLKES